MPLLILLRHGKSVWNEKNLFTGWVDIPLSETGINEALKAGSVIRHLPVDIIYTSCLVRSLMTALLAMTSHESGKVPFLVHDEDSKAFEKSFFDNPEEKKQLIPLIQNSSLNERMYGKLQGKNKAATEKEFGKEQVALWRRSFRTQPPEGESLFDTAQRAVPYFNDFIKKDLDNDKNVLIAAHGNSLRSLVMEIDRLSEEEVLSLEIPTGYPIIYKYENGNFSKYR
ncbi:MAG: 2,3-bisphosphoglycerate-dependent phosphoglycerate mutase [Victivallaceae bacterium]